MKLYPNITAIFIIWAMSVLTVFFFGFSNFPHSDKFSNNFWENLANWDGGHYLGIAEFGYREKFQYAFFPLYPILIKTVSLISKNYLFSSLLVSIASSFFAVHLLYGLVAEDFDKKKSEKVVLCLLFFPTSFYFLTAYSESLFLFLAVASFYALRKNQLILATILVSLASSTKISGLALVFSFLLYILMTYGFNKRYWFVLLSPLGFIIYCWFLFQQTGDPFYFLTAENHWQRYLTIPGVSFWETIRNIASGSLTFERFTILLDLLFAVFGIGFALRSLKFLPPIFSSFIFFSMSLPLLTSTLTSMPRFLVVIFPIFILLALIRNKYSILIYQIISLTSLSLFATLFINGFWVS